MESSIIWETNWEEALKKAKSKERPILLDFFNPD
jgi:hypothetical protein